MQAVLHILTNWTCTFCLHWACLVKTQELRNGGTQSIPTVLLWSLFCEAFLRRDLEFKGAVYQWLLDHCCRISSGYVCTYLCWISLVHSPTTTSKALCRYVGRIQETEFNGLNSEGGIQRRLNSEKEVIVKVDIMKVEFGMSFISWELVLHTYVCSSQHVHLLMCRVHQPGPGIHAPRHQLLCFGFCAGGLEGGKHLILTFPDTGLRHLDGNADGFSELLTTLVYFKTLIRWVW